MTTSQALTLDEKGIKDLLFNILKTLYYFERVEVQEFGLTYEQIYLLKYLHRNPSVYVRTLAEEMRIALFSATRLIDQMEKKKLVVRNADKKDRRNKHVDITAKGENLVKKIEQYAYSIIVQNLIKFPETEILSIIQLAQNFDKILGVPTADKE